MKAVVRAFIAAVMKSTTFAVFVRRTKLWAIAIFGIAPFAVSRTRSCSPGLAVMVGMLNFISSVPMISTVRPPLAAAAAAGFSVAGFWVAPAAGFWFAGVWAAIGAASMIDRITCWYINSASSW